MRIQVNARNRGLHFDAVAAQPVLYAGLGAGVDLPYECATGTCGTCRAKVVEGRIRDDWPEAPGRKVLKSSSDFLMCQCAAETDLTLEIPSFVNPAGPGACRAAPLAGVLRTPTALTHDVMSFGVELDAPCEFDAGQFMVLQAQGVSGYRAYSMVNHQRVARRLEFVIKRKPGGGFSEWLFGAPREGAPLRLFGPLGKATYYPALGKDVLCIAGGSGVAGMMSILSCAAGGGALETHRAWLFFGVRTAKDAFYLEELSQLSERCGERLAVTVALSDEPVSAELSARWPRLRFAQGLVHEVAKQAMAGRYRDVRAYVAGPPPAVDAVLRVLLLEAKLTADNIRYDKFS
ncbi:MAG: 2Fe-2S iron-sulfur cluster binding domain-containing protein [Alphaproteobacteria bacterium]|nr:2Fe-2S iron-sulfur cluster binding domain-containing protein [Alphaproteobacteria bacterium]